LVNEDQLELVADIVKAYVSNNALRAGELPKLIADVSASLSALSAPPAAPAMELTPAVNPKRSVFADHILSLENGKPFKSLKRHLSTLGMTPDDYRRKWGLPSDYPMVAADYASKRSELARRIGLGRKDRDPGEGGEGDAVAKDNASPAPVKTRRPRARKKSDAANAEAAGTDGEN
jgi:predicted transcriptional regulator